MTAETWQGVIRRKSNTVSRVFATSDGQELLKLLDETFCQKSPYDSDSHKMSYNVGQQDLCKYLQQLKSIGEQ